GRTWAIEDFRVAPPPRSRRLLRPLDRAGSSASLLLRPPLRLSGLRERGARPLAYPLLRVGGAGALCAHAPGARLDRTADPLLSRSGRRHPRCDLRLLPRRRLLHALHRRLRVLALGLARGRGRGLAPRAPGQTSRRSTSAPPWRTSS